MIPIEPLFGRVLVKPEPVEELVVSGLIIPVSNKERWSAGEVVRIGKLATNVQVGQKVLFKKYSVEEVEFEKQTYLIMAEEDILAIINKPKS